MRRALVVGALAGATCGALALFAASERAADPVPSSAPPASLRTEPELPDVPRSAPSPLLPAVASTAADTAPSPQPAAGGLAADASSQALEVTGVVRGSDGAPLAGADVWFVPSGQVLRAAGFEIPSTIPFIGLGRKGPDLLMHVPLAALEHVRTDAQGRFSIRGPGEGGEAGRDPYPPPAVPALLVSSSGHGVRAQALRDPAEPLEIELEREGLVAGRVVDEAGAPLAGVSVRVTDNYDFQSRGEGARHFYDPAVLLGDLHATTSGPDGTFRLGGLMPGRAELACVQAGRISRFESDVPVVATETTDLGDLVLALGGVIEGRVVDETGRGLAGASVFATSREVGLTGRGCVISSLDAEDDGLLFELEAGLRRDACHARSLADGRFRIEGVGVPTVTLYAQAAGREPARLRDVSTGAIDAVLALAPEAVLSVRVVEQETGRAVSAATLEARRVVGEGHDTAPLRVERSEDGYVVHGAGRLGTELVATAAGFAPATTRVDGQSPGSARDATVELQRAAALSGWVRRPDGQPVAGAGVSLSRPSDPYPVPVVSTRSAEDGSFVLSGLSASEWLLQAKCDGSAPANPVPLTTEVGRTVEGLELVLESAATLEIVIYAVEAGLAAPPHRVWIRKPGAPEKERPVATGSSKPDGRCTFGNLPPGRFDVVIEDVATLDVALAAGEQRTLRIDADPPRVVVRVLEGGRPAAGIRVSVRREGETRSRWGASAPSDASGRIERLLPSPGRFELLAYPGDEERQNEVVGRSAVFSVEEGESREVELALATGSLSGVVESSRGPVAGEDLFVEGAEGDGYRLVRTDEAGRFTVQRLVPGTYRIETNGNCEHGGHVRVDSGPLELADGQQRAGLRLELRWGARITGTVRGPSGALAPESSTVRLMGAEGDTQFGVASVVQGRYEIGGVAPGRYRLCSSRERSWTQPSPGVAGQPVEVVGEGELAVDLVLPADE